MLRKWEWIAEKCEELGFKRCGKLAKEIDKILCDTILTYRSLGRRL